MWLGERDLPAARAWFAAAVHRVPAYAPALGHLAEVDAALGAPDAAINRLRPLAVSSDDPEHAVTLARVLSDAGRPREAERWRVYAASRYEELVSRHPEAFAHHVIVDRARQRTWRPLPGRRPCPGATIRQDRITRQDVGQRASRPPTGLRTSGTRRRPRRHSLAATWPRSPARTRAPSRRRVRRRVPMCIVVDLSGFRAPRSPAGHRVAGVSGPSEASSGLTASPSVGQQGRKPRRGDQPWPPLRSG